MRFTNLFLLLILIGGTALLSSCGTKSRLATADKKFEAGEYASAVGIYNVIYGRIPSTDRETKARVAFRQGESLRFLNNTRAEMMYQRAIRFNYPDSTVFLRYAQALHRNGKYNDALNQYRRYLEYDSTSVLSRNGIIAIDSISVWRNQPTRHVVRRDNFLYQRNSNTFSPMYQADDANVLYFSSNRTRPRKGVLPNFVTLQPNTNIFMIKKDAAGKWSKPEPIFADEFAEKHDIGVSGFSPDGRTMYMTIAAQQSETDASAEIFYMSRAGGEWTEPKKVTFFRDSTISVAHPTIASDGQTIYFVSDAPNGQGGKDIWRGVLSGDECKFIENLGPDINTPGDEMFPLIRPDGTLYFSSDGHPGFGGLDLFRANLIPNDKNVTTDSVAKTPYRWVVVNMGTPINSNFDDFGITFANGTDAGFFSSNRGQSRGYDAIWSFEIPVMEVIVAGTVYDDKMTPLPDAVVRLISNTGQNIRVVTRKDGSYRIKIDKDMECVMLGSARGFLNKTAALSTEGVTDSKTFTVDMVLPAIFRPVQLRNIFFEFAKWDLTPSSEAGLQELLSMLTDNPNITIEISAHTDYVGNNEANLLLSQRRAQSVVDYLIGAGIPVARLVSIGHGEEKPFIVDEQTAAEYPFLEVNTILTEEFIKSLPADEQVVANQINRRTEFKVLRMNYR